MPGHREKGKQAGEKERETKIDSMVPMQEGKLLPGAPISPLKLLPIAKTHHAGFCGTPLVLPVPRVWASLWIPRTPKALSRRTQSTWIRVRNMGSSSVSAMSVLCDFKKGPTPSSCYKNKKKTGAHQEVLKITSTSSPLRDHDIKGLEMV